MPLKKIVARPLLCELCGGTMVAVTQAPKKVRFEGGKTVSHQCKLCKHQLFLESRK